jgi:hypothetical protein
MGRFRSASSYACLLLCVPNHLIPGPSAFLGKERNCHAYIGFEVKRTAPKSVEINFRSRYNSTSNGGVNPKAAAAVRAMFEFWGYTVEIGQTGFPNDGLPLPF